MAKLAAMESPAASDVRPIPAGSDRPTQLALYRMMVRLRVFEKRANDLFFENLVKGTVHLGIGQEAIAAGFAQAMRSDDWTYATYRGHNHTLARGADPTATMAELLGRSTGLTRGKGGSMHLTDVSVGMMGSYAIIGAHLPIAAGAAWSAKLRKSGQIAVCFFGDGTTNIGAFHEALNLSVIWKLPVVFVCENNLYMEYTSIESVTAVEHPAAGRAAAYGLEPILIDGNDVDVCFATARTAYARARAGDGPSLIEAKTYRHGGHSRADNGSYRPKGELEEWLLRDPIDSYRARLVKAGIPAAELAAIDAETAAWIEPVVADAKAAPEPSDDLLLSNLWADGGSAWHN
jgi:TPP-dependent pyruvate/acetoin dehydrogenase alpha subunit